MTSRHVLRRTAALALAALAALLLLACTSSGDGGLVGTPTGTLDPSTNVPTGTQGYAFLQQEGSGSGTLCVGVWVDRVIDLYSVSFTLSFDPTVMRFASAAPGSFLGTAAQTLPFQVDTEPDQPPGIASSVIVGLTRNRDTAPTGVNGGPGKVATVCFDLVGPATASIIRFTPNRRGQDSTGADVIPDLDTHWLGGTITVQ